MEKKKIGIKIADGSFYPILDGDTKQKKRMVLTTVKDGQESVQIDLYRGAGETLEEAQYIGSLMVENISPAAKGEAEIELDLGMDDEGQLESIAMDKASGAKQSLSVSLRNLDEEGLYEVPDFSFEDEEPGEVLEEELPDFDKEDILDEDFDLEGDGEIEGVDELEGPESLEEPEGFEETESLEVPEDIFEEPGEFEGAEEFEEPLESFDMDLDEDFGEELSEEVSEDIGEEFPEAEEEFEEPEAVPETDTESQWKQEYTRLNEGFEEDSAEEKEIKPRRTRPLLVALLVILALALIGALLYLFVFVSGDEETPPPLEAMQEQEQTITPAPAEEEPPAVEQPEEEAVVEAPIVEAEEPDLSEDGSSGPESSGPTETVSKDQVEYTGGVWYKIRWGDTLWEISSSFYNNPWLYGQIANENEIPNPDKIYADDSIFIPKK